MNAWDKDWLTRRIAEIMHRYREEILGPHKKLDMGFLVAIYLVGAFDAKSALKDYSDDEPPKPE